MSDDFSQLDVAIEAKFRAVGWQAAGQRYREEAPHGDVHTTEVVRNGRQLAPPSEWDQAGHLTAQPNCAKERPNLQSIDDRLGVVAEVLNRRSRMNGGSGNGSDPRAALRSEILALRTDMTEMKARLESLTTVLIEFGNLTRRTMASTTTEVLVEVGKLSDQVARLARSSRPRPEISRNQPIVRER